MCRSIHTAAMPSSAANSTSLHDKDSRLEPARYFRSLILQCDAKRPARSLWFRARSGCVARDPGTITEDSSLHSNGLFVASKLRIKAETRPHRLSPDVATCGKHTSFGWLTPPARNWPNGARARGPRGLNLQNGFRNAHPSDPAIDIRARIKRGSSLRSTCDSTLAELRGHQLS